MPPRTAGVTDAATGALPAESNGAPWHTRSVEQLTQSLESGPDGLSSDEARRRRDRYGPNEIEAEREVPWWTILIHQFRDPLIYILLVAGAATLALRDYTDSGVILAVVLTNAIVGFVQEFRARAAMRALASMSAPRAEVLRDGDARTVEGRELVPGDVVLLASGGHVPADLRLLAVNDLEIDESALTGESAAARKTVETLETADLVAGDQTNMAFAGTTVTRGRGRGLVVRTGGRTEVGRIAAAMREVGEVATPLQEKVARFGRGIGLIVAALAVLVGIVGLVRGLDPRQILLTVVAMAVSSIPEGLPVVLTVTLAIAVRRMARRRAIIRSLPAVETLGSTTVIGTDKTGTLTTNEMTVRAIWIDGSEYEVTGVGYGSQGSVRRNGEDVQVSMDAALRRALLAGTLANEADPAIPGGSDGEVRGDPTEVALHVVAAKAGLDPEDVRARSGETDVLPFEPERRFMATANEVDGERVLMLKGAPEVLLPRCTRMVSGDGSERELDARTAQAAADELAHRGLRVLALAYASTSSPQIDERALESGIVLAGLAGMEDPLRPESVEAVRSAHEAGIRVVMITGDHVETAQAIGAQVGLSMEHGSQVGQDVHALSDAQLDDVVRRVEVFARVAPEHKLRIVERLKAIGEIVAVTGDGVNDAPALRAAHIGVAMGASGTDVAREAADMVLADDNFATITAAVEEGRVVFSNIRKVTFFLLSTAVGEVMTILFALAAGWPLPFVAAQILWINLATNGLQDVALAFEPGEPGMLRQPPRKRTEGLLTWRLVERLGAVGVVLAAGTLGVFWWTLRNTGDLDLARTVAVTQMVVFQFFHVFNSRSLDRSIFTVPLFSNRPLFASLLAAAAAHAAVLHWAPLQRVFRTVPLDLEHWAIVILVGTTVILGGELDKAVNRYRGRLLG